MVKEETKLQKETCLICGYDGMDDESVVASRDGCPECGSRKLTMEEIDTFKLRERYDRGEIPVLAFVVRDSVKGPVDEP